MPFAARVIRVCATVAGAVTLAALAVAARPLLARQAPYTVITADARRPLPVRTINGADMIALDQLATLFGAALHEDALAGAMTIQTARQSIILTTGQAAASVSGRVLSMSAPVTRDGRTWYVPVDFLSRVLAQATGQRIDVRPATRTVIVGDLRWPQVAVRLERQGLGVRVSGDVQPATPFRLTRDGNRLTVQFDAVGLDFSLAGASAPDLVGAVRVTATGTAIAVELGPNASIVRPNQDAANTQWTIDVAPAPRPGQEAPPPAPGAGTALRVIAIDAGHGGDDHGATAANGAMEKQITLALAQRLKAAIDARLGVRVLMTREGDDTLPIDRRAAIVNNGQADVLISLHADASLRDTPRGAQVLTLDPALYRLNAAPADLETTTVPIAGGGTRDLSIVPWELAQLPHLAASNDFAASVARRLSERQVPMYDPAVSSLPLRLLAGANMTAVIVNVGFLSNKDDAAMLAGPDLPNAIVEALMASLTELRSVSTRGGER